jgi:hypothetical protein
MTVHNEGHWIVTLRDGGSNVTSLHRVTTDQLLYFVMVALIQEVDMLQRYPNCLHSRVHSECRTALEAEA